MSINNPSTVSLLLKKVSVHFSRNAMKYSAVVTIAISASAYMYFAPAKVVNETVVIKLGDLKQYVAVTGAVQSSKDASLAFQTLGVVSNLAVKVGDVVSQGKVLAVLDGSDARANLLQAEAQLASAEAVLGQLTQGSRKEELAIKQQAVDNAKSTLDQSYVAIPDTIRNVDGAITDVVKSKLNPLFVNSGEHYRLSFSSCDQNLQSSVEDARNALETVVNDYQKKSGTVSVLSEQSYTDTVFEQAYSVTVSTNNLVNSVSALLLSSCSTQNASLDGYRTTLSLVKTTMNTLFTDISSKRNALSIAKNTLSQATRDLDLTKAGTDPYKVKAQAALVSQAQAGVVQAESGLNKTVITAPFTGTISDVAITQGETVTSGKTVIKMLAIDSFEVEAKVPEVDIVKIKMGALVDVTLDAYGKAVVFPATVTRINPTATIEGSVPMYKVIITFVGKDSRIKSGMTANVNIITESKSQVIIVPTRFIQVTDDMHATVVLKSQGKDVVTKKEIITGIRGQDGLIEVVSGLTPGDVVVAPSTGTRSAQKQTN